MGMSLLLYELADVLFPLFIVGLVSRLSEGKANSRVGSIVTSYQIRSSRILKQLDRNAIIEICSSN